MRRALPLSASCACFTRQGSRDIRRRSRSVTLLGLPEERYYAWIAGRVRALQQSVPVVSRGREAAPRRV